MNLELMALRWLWLDKKCHYVLEQRCPRLFNGVPDVIGITKSRYLIEIEIKRSVADFRSDGQKSSKRHREFYLKHFPKQFYYLMPLIIYEKVKDEIPDWAGAMVEAENNLTCWVKKSAPTNNKSERLSLEECVRAVRHITNHMMTVRLKLETCGNRFRERDDTTFTQWVDSKNGTYQI